MHDLYLKLYICIGKIVVEGTVSLYILYFLYRSWFIFDNIYKIIFNKMYKNLPVFLHKI